jgi:hypothetical protein
MSDPEETQLEARLAEQESFEPPESFVEEANVSDPGIYEEFEENWPDCWKRAADLLVWESDYEETLVEEDAPFYEWFVGGELNAAYNCLDRHLDSRGDELAIQWEGELGDTREFTYEELHREVNEFAAALRGLGVEEDDVVTLYLPMIPELPIAMLACARIGAPHSVVFAGFSADALATRMKSADSAYLVTCDGYYRRGDALNHMSRADRAVRRVDGDVDPLENAFAEHPAGPDGAEQTTEDQVEQIVAGVDGRHADEDRECDHDLAQGRGPQPPGRAQPFPNSLSQSRRGGPLQQGGVARCGRLGHGFSVPERWRHRTSDGASSRASRRVPVSRCPASHVATTRSKATATSSGVGTLVGSSSG